MRASAWHIIQGPAHRKERRAETGLSKASWCLEVLAHHVSLNLRSPHVHVDNMDSVGHLDTLDTYTRAKANICGAGLTHIAESSMWRIIQCPAHSSLQLARST